MKVEHVILFALATIVVNVDGIFVLNATKAPIRASLSSPVDWTETSDDDDGIWSTLLEDWTIGDHSFAREGKVLQPNPKYIPTSGFYITKRIGETMELEPHKRPPGGKVISSAQPTFGVPMRQNYGSVASSPREVSETDLYLLGAIEKLVYRVDYMEKRLRRVEQLMYFVMQGNNQKEEICPENFTRAGSNCYHFGTNREINWKSANVFCKSLSAQLAEFEAITENQELTAFLLNHPHHKGKNFWLGGLNPGLLWIWSNSARPINPNTNVTVTAGNSSNSTTPSDNNKNQKESNKKDPNWMEIKGNGRCLRFSYNPALHTYGYTGEDCSIRHHYLCEYKDRKLDNEISRLAKELEFRETQDIQRN